MGRLRSAAALALVLAAGCTSRPPPARAVSAAWVRLPAVAGRPGAAYFTLRAGPAPARLVAIDSARVATIELHESMAGMGDMAGMTTMRPIAGVDVAAGGSIAFAPDGRHAMLFGIDPRVRPGDRVPLRFRFADGAPLVASARAVAAGDPPPAAEVTGRPLTAGEIALARSVFGDAIDYARVRLHRRRWWPLQPANVVMAPDGDVWFAPASPHWAEDFARAPIGLQGLFVHELTHVWQAQRSGRWWLPLMRHPFCRYAYRLVPGRRFERYGIEQQAEIVRHAWLAARAGAAAGELAALLPFGPGRG